MFLDGLAALAEHPLVGDVRGVGLIAGVELMADKARREPFPAAAGMGVRVQTACEQEGLIVRAIGDRIAFTPPLILDAAEARELCARFGPRIGRGLGGDAGGAGRGRVAPE